MGAPIWASNSAGNALSSVTLTHGGSALQTFTLDYTSVMRGKFQVQSTGGASVSSTNGTQVTVYSRADGGRDAGQ
jgi:hypothetical protein